MTTVEPGLLELLAQGAAASESAGELGSESVEALRRFGIFRSLVPAEVGGSEVAPADLHATVERIAAADGAAGWCAAIGATAGLAAAHLPAPQARELLGDDEAIPAGVFAPRGRLTAGSDGVQRLTGRWPLGSGVGHSTVAGLGCIDPDRGPLYSLLPRSEVEIVETWDSLGLRATASHDVVVEGVAVPAERVIDLIGGEPVAEGSLYAFPLFGLLAVAVSAVCTGIAQGALDDLIAAAAARKPAGSARRLAERATTQESAAAATASLRAARAGVTAAIEIAWSTAERGDPLTVGERAGLRLAATHASQTAVTVVDVAHRLGGAGALYRGSTIERRLRDVHTAAQHMVVAPATMELAGRVLLGIETDIDQL